MRIVCQDGHTSLETQGLYATYRTPLWVLRLNPLLKVPGRRRSSFKVIEVNGKRWGKAYYCEGCIPMPPYISEDGRGIHRVFDAWKIHIGLGVRRANRGYFLIKLKQNKFIVLRRVTNEKRIYGAVYQYMSGDLVGTYIFDEEFKNVLLKTNEGALPNSLKVIAGYLADVSVYSQVVGLMNREVSIVMPEFE